MFQRAHLRNRDVVTVTRQTTHDVGFGTVGKRSMTQDMPSRPEPTSRYDSAIESAKREINAVRWTALPALCAAMRRKEMAPLAKEMAITQAAIQLRHMLLTANQHVYALEKAATYADPIVLFLRNEVKQLATRAMKLGAYRGFEDLAPRAYEDPNKQKQQGPRKTLARKPDQKHVPAKSASTSSQPASVTRAKSEIVEASPRKPIQRSQRLEAY